MFWGYHHLRKHPYLEYSWILSPKERKVAQPHWSSIISIEHYSQSWNRYCLMIFIHVLSTWTWKTLEGCNKEKSQQTTWGLLSLFDLRLDGLDHPFHAFPHAWGRSSSSNNTKNNTQGHLLRTPTIELRTTFINSIPGKTCQITCDRIWLENSLLDMFNSLHLGLISSSHCWCFSKEFLPWQVLSLV